MNNDTLVEKPPLETLFTPDLFDLINATASQLYGTYGKRNPHSTMITQEDLASQGCLGATTAYESFDPALGYNRDVTLAFRTYAFPYIRNAMMTYCRKFSHTLSISEKAAREELHAITSIGVVHIDQFDDGEEFDVPVGSGVEISPDVDDYFLAGFSLFERKLVKDHIIGGYSLQELSERHNISKSRAGKIIAGLTDRMRERAEDYDKND